MNSVFFAMDGDAIGKRLEQYIFTSDTAGLHTLSLGIQEDVRTVSALLRAQGGTVHMEGGDNLLGECTQDAAAVLLRAVTQINAHRAYHFSVGIADSMIGAYMALKYAKLSGKAAVRYVREGFEEVPLP
ncbi:MAG: mCpol domain-containing protein [Oscillospiraceae bacterium]|nr:mCpol domain-containing protein [Oscillospiraceae bacterium]